MVFYLGAERRKMGAWRFFLGRKGLEKSDSEDCSQYIAAHWTAGIRGDELKGSTCFRHQHIDLRRLHPS
jgi:hypothetical protein